MRNRPEPTSFAETDENDEEQFEEDSGEDWKPEKKEAKGGVKRRSVGRRSAAKKPKKEESEEEEDEDEEDEEEDESEEEDEEDDEEEEGGTKKKGGAAKKRPTVHVGKNQPDKDGNMELYLFKNDLTKEFRTDEKLCMWRRDGASLLQKYMVVVHESATTDIIFKASSVYSCWEEKRKNDFFQIKVQMVGDKKEGKVQVSDVEEFVRYSQEDRPKVDITPKGADGTDNYDEDEEDPDEEDEEEE